MTTGRRRAGAGSPCHERLTRCIARAPFRAAWWLPSAHLQTVFPHISRSLPRIRWRYERLELDDGDFLDLAWHGEPSRPVIAIFTGLEGSAKSGYVRHVAHAASRAGLTTLVMHHRGCSGEHNRTLASYHAGHTSDIDRTLDHVAGCGQPPWICAVGFSLGGNALLKWAGERNAGYGKVCALVSVSAPVDLEVAAATLEQGISRVYQSYLLALLKRKTVDKIARLERSGQPVSLDVAALRGARSFRRFDDVVTAPLNGFRDSAEYYARASARPWLRNITVPTLMINALDDPFMHPRGLPTLEELASTTILELSPKGGHVGFVDAKIPGQRGHWLERRILSFCEEHRRR